MKIVGVSGFRVTTSGQTVGATSWETIEFDTESYDENSEWDTTNFKFTAKKDGTYLFCLRASLLNMDSQKAIALRIRKNGTTVAYADHRPDHGGATPAAANVSAIVRLVVDDYVHFEVYNEDDDNRSLNTSGGSTSAEGQKIA